MTLALALAAMGYLLGWLAGQASGFRKALEELDEPWIEEEPDSFLAVQRENAPWQ